MSRNIPTQVESTENAISVPLQRGLISCPVTLEIFFEPSISAPCQHIFEADKGMQRSGMICPSCRAENITLSPAPPMIRELLSNTLGANPHLWRDVYFNLDRFVETIEGNERQTIIDQRFITLLQNAPNHLNDKALDGKYKDKSAVEILAGTAVGRNLLREHPKIRANISAASLALVVEGRAIADWLRLPAEAEMPKTEKKEVELAKAYPSAIPASRETPGAARTPGAPEGAACVDPNGPRPAISPGASVVPLNINKLAVGAPPAYLSQFFHQNPSVCSPPSRGRHSPTLSSFGSESFGKPPASNECVLQ